MKATVVLYVEIQEPNAQAWFVEAGRATRVLEKALFEVISADVISGDDDFQKGAQP